jgi:hypothetical protein
MKSIHDICKQYGIENYTVNDDGSIDVLGDVNLWNKGLTELPLTFNKVSGDFDCGFNQLTSLKGCPRWIGGWFSCYNNQLTSLEFGPDYIVGYFDCDHNRLTSLEFSSYYVGGNFLCESNYLTDNYCETEIRGDFYTTLEQDGLIFDDNKATNYNEWRKIYKRKQILNELYTRHM